MAMRYQNLELDRTDDISMMDDNIYLNTSWSGMLGEKWMLNTGTSGSYDFGRMKMSDDRIRTAVSSGALKAVLTNSVNNDILLKIGSELITHSYGQDILMGAEYRLNTANTMLAGFAESELNIGRKIAVRLGARSEYHSYLRALNLVPRFSAAIKTGKYAQLSAGIGKFLQNPGDDYLKISPELLPECSFHYILNYQYSHDLRTLRVEAYFKEYSGLVKYTDQYSVNPRDFSNTGYGDAGGIDVFWRDQSTFANTDYWISYSFIRSGRDYRDYPEYSVPGFVSEHNLSLVYKRFFSSIHSFAGLNYTFASGRPYHDFSFNFTYITSLFKKQTILHLMANNFLGFENIFGYHFSRIPGADGRYEGRPIIAPVNRQLVLALIIML
jgi:hypothetical protein